MSYYSKNEYTFVKFEKATAQNKKYKAILKNKDTGRTKTINFGDKRYQQYKDTTGLGLYTNLNHNDAIRRASYRKRHQRDIRDGYYSAGWFSMKYLW